jgi:hypothetical protein
MTVHRPIAFDRYVVADGVARGAYVTDAVAIERAVTALRAGRTPPPLQRDAVRWFARRDEAEAYAKRRNGR